MANLVCVPGDVAEEAVDDEEVLLSGLFLNAFCVTLAPFSMAVCDDFAATKEAFPRLSRLSRDCQKYLHQHDEDTGIERSTYSQGFGHLGRGLLAERTESLFLRIPQGYPNDADGRDNQVGKSSSGDLRISTRISGWLATAFLGGSVGLTYLKAAIGRAALL